MAWAKCYEKSLESISHMNAVNYQRTPLTCINFMINSEGNGYFKNEKLCWHQDSNPLPSNPVILPNSHTSPSLGVYVSFLNMGQPQPLLFIFHGKAFYNNELQSGHSVETFSAPKTSCVHFPGLSQLHGRESWVGINVCYFALQDGVVTIIRQTIEDKMSLAKLRRFISVESVK